MLFKIISPTRILLFRGLRIKLSSLHEVFAFGRPCITLFVTFEFVVIVQWKNLSSCHSNGLVQNHFALCWLLNCNGVFISSEVLCITTPICYNYVMQVDFFFSWWSLICPWRLLVLFFFFFLQSVTIKNESY